MRWHFSDSLLAAADGRTVSQNSHNLQRASVAADMGSEREMLQRPPRNVDEDRRSIRTTEVRRNSGSRPEGGIYGQRSDCRSARLPGCRSLTRHAVVVMPPLLDRNVAGAELAAIDSFGHAGKLFTLAYKEAAAAILAAINWKYTGEPCRVVHMTRRSRDGGDLDGVGGSAALFQTDTLSPRVNPGHSSGELSLRGATDRKRSPFTVCEMIPSCDKALNGVAFRTVTIR